MISAGVRLSMLTNEGDVVGSDGDTAPGTTLP